MARIFLQNFRSLFLVTHELNIHHLKCCHTDDKLEKETEIDQPSILYIDTSKDYAFGKQSAARKLQELFNLRTFTANDIVTRYANLCKVTGKTISNNYTLLKSEGVCDSVMLDYADILAQNDTELKIDILKRMSYEINDTAPLLSVKKHKLISLINKLLICRNRLKNTAELFEVPIVQACGYLVSRPFLYNISMKKLETNLKLLLEFGVQMEQIKSDFWVLQYSSDIIRDRLEMAKMLKVEKLKTWMVRSKPEIFNTYVQRICDNKEILGENSIGEYLSKCLDCPSNHVKLILTKHPALLHKSVRKMTEIIDSLIKNGFTTQHIVRNPKILLHSVETTQLRLKELESLGIKLDSLCILTKSQKQYMQYYESLVKSNKAKVKDSN